MFCTNCDREHPAPANYCPDCGLGLRDGGRPAPAPPIPEEYFRPARQAASPGAEAAPRGGQPQPSGGARRLAMALGLVGCTVTAGVGLGVLLSEGYESSGGTVSEPLPSFALPSKRSSATATPSVAQSPRRGPSNLGVMEDQSPGPDPDRAPVVSLATQATVRPQAAVPTQSETGQPGPAAEPSPHDRADRARPDQPGPDPDGPDPDGPGHGRDRDGWPAWPGDGRPPQEHPGSQPGGDGQTFPDHVQSCGGGVGAGPLADCQQARLVARKVPRGADGVFLVESDDPRTGERSTYTCVSARYVLCTGGRGVSVYIEPGMVPGRGNRG
ncbi:hypothetical protein ACTQ49_01280 [Luteococcus sp. Sow4_B9]|uniref:hypothetical protein n=1 Tax=Luteococcus sp. Sow4_B9 TaxID=3438792 RepID=UPI003F990C10